MVSDPRACPELLPQQVDLVVDKDQRGGPEHLIPHDPTPEVHRVLELIFAIVPFIEAVERSDEKDGVKAFEE